MILPAYQGYSDARQKLHEIDKKLLQQQKDNEVLRVTNQKLKSDSRAIERVAREKFGWSKSGEKIYDFSN
jgi:cell division protein FtsB